MAELPILCSLVDYSSELAITTGLFNLLSVTIYTFYLALDTATYL